MKPYKVEIYLYANSEAEVEEARKAAREFVMYHYGNGCIVTALRFADVLRKFQTNPIVTKFLHS
ncbi:MAG: hypothetical protein IIW50_07460 [Alistipes sp.]|jgi:hypothetical protein|nr:hypothetical protein [Alistipes sp.]